MDLTGNDSTQVNLLYTGKFDWGILEACVYHEKSWHQMHFFDDELFWCDPNVTAQAIDGMPCAIQC